MTEVKREFSTGATRDIDQGKTPNPEAARAIPVGAGRGDAGFEHPRPEAVKSGALLKQEKAEALEADAQRRGEAADPGRPDAIYPPPQDRWDLA